MKKIIIVTVVLLLSIVLLTSQRQKWEVYKGIASYYHNKYNGRTTTNGEIYNSKKFTGASNTIRIGTYVKVTNPENGRIVYVKINDRLARNNKRLIDLSRKSAEMLKYTKKGITDVIVEEVSESEAKKHIMSQKAKHV